MIVPKQKQFVTSYVHIVGVGEMTITKFLSTDKLIEYLEEELRTLLNDRGVYEVEHYGWMDDDVPDPDYIGHAMWQVSPPAVAFQGGRDRQGKARSEAVIDRLMSVGMEFTALVKSSRLSLGHALLHEEMARSSTYGDDLNFWLHNADAMMKLGMASLKIREYFVVSLINERVEAYDHQLMAKFVRADGSQADFMTPFKEANGLIDEKVRNRFQLENCFSALVPIMGVANAYYQNRNTVPSPHAARDRNDRVDAGEACTDCAGHETNGRPEIDMAIREMTNWYRTLVEASNLVFLVEHLLGNTQCEIIKMGAGQVHTVD